MYRADVWEVNPQKGDWWRDDNPGDDEGDNDNRDNDHHLLKLW